MFYISQHPSNLFAGRLGNEHQKVLGELRFFVKCLAYVIKLPCTYISSVPFNPFFHCSREICAFPQRKTKKGYVCQGKTFQFLQMVGVLKTIRVTFHVKINFLS